VTQEVDCLPSKLEALNSKPTTTKKKKRKKSKKKKKERRVFQGWKEYVCVRHVLGEDSRKVWVLPYRLIKL
jgi:hypothetical protein